MPTIKDILVYTANQSGGEELLNHPDFVINPKQYPHDRKISTAFADEIMDQIDLICADKSFNFMIGRLVMLLSLNSFHN